MQELSMTDIDEVAGGNPLIIRAVGFVAGTAGTALYNYVGGYAGINNFASNVAGAYYSSVTTYGYNPYL